MNHEEHCFRCGRVLTTCALTAFVAVCSCWPKGLRYPDLGPGGTTPQDIAKMFDVGGAIAAGATLPALQQPGQQLVFGRDQVAIVQQLYDDELASMDSWRRARLRAVLQGPGHGCTAAAPPRAV